MNQKQWQHACIQKARRGQHKHPSSKIKKQQRSIVNKKVIRRQQNKLHIETKTFFKHVPQIHFHISGSDFTKKWYWHRVNEKVFMICSTCCGLYSPFKDQMLKNILFWKTMSKTFSFLLNTAELKIDTTPFIQTTAGLRLAVCWHKCLTTL